MTSHDFGNLQIRISDRGDTQCFPEALHHQLCVEVHLFALAQHRGGGFRNWLRPSKVKMPIDLPVEPLPYQEDELGFSGYPDLSARTRVCLAQLGTRLP